MSHTSLLTVLADASAPAPQSSQQQLLDIDSTLFVQLGLFLLVLLVLSRFLWKPYLAVKSERIRRVDGYREDARTMEATAKSRLDKIELELGEARRAGSAERTRARAEAQVEENKLVAQAQSSAQAALTAARAKVEAAMEAERASLATRATQLGREAAERVLGRKVA